MEPDQPCPAQPSPDQTRRDEKRQSMQQRVAPSRWGRWVVVVKAAAAVISVSLVHLMDTRGYYGVIKLFSTSLQWFTYI